MISHIRRAAVSVPLNIAEGSVKKFSKELAVLVDLSMDIGYISAEEHRDISLQIDDFNKKLFLFIRHVEKECGSRFFQKFPDRLAKLS